MHFLLAVVVLDGWVRFLDGSLAGDCLAMAGDLTISRTVCGLVSVLFEVFTCGKEAQLSVGEFCVSSSYCCISGMTVYSLFTLAW